MRNFHTKRRVFVALLFCLVLFGCTAKKCQEKSCCKAKQYAQDHACAHGFEKVIVIDKTGLDACGFMLQRADSSLFEVDNFPDSLKTAGQTICIKYHISKQQMSVCMAGQRIELLEIKK